MKMMNDLAETITILTLVFMGSAVLGLVIIGVKVACFKRRMKKK